MKVSFRTRRKQKIKAIKTYKIITFKLKEISFALPLQKVLKIIIADEQYQHPTLPDQIITKHKDQTIIVVNVDQYIYNKSQTNNSNVNSNQDNINTIKTETTTNIIDRYLLLFQNDLQPDILGLPLDSPPKILEITKSQLKKLPSQLGKIGNISLISDKVIQTQNNSPYVVISSNKIFIDNS